MAALELPTACPAAMALPTVRQRKDEVPGVRCRVEHSTLDVLTSPRSIVGFCCASPASPCAKRTGEERSTSYADCPSWQLEKLTVWMGFKSLGDERELDAATDRAYREDVTGSPYGDTSLMDTVARVVDESAEAIQAMSKQGGGVIGWSS